MSKKQQSIHSKAINAFITAIVNALYVWASKWNNESFFFLVIGDKECTDVAWSNINGAACDGAIAISMSPETAAAFEILHTSVDMLVEDTIKDDPKFGDELHGLDIDDFKDGWCSVENANDEEKGGEQ